MNNALIKHGKWFMAIIFASTIFSAVSVYARTMKNRPICNIEGIIKSVKFKDSIFNADPSVYLLGININSVSGSGSETGFYTCQSFYTIGEVREIFIVENDIKAGDIFSVGQKINGVINDGGYRAGDLDGLFLVNYTLGAVTPENQQLEEKMTESTANPVIKNDNDQKEVAQKTEPNQFLIIGGGILGFFILLGFLFLFYRKR